MNYSIRATNVKPGDYCNVDGQYMYVSAVSHRGDVVQLTFAPIAPAFSAYRTSFYNYSSVELVR